MLSIQKQNNLTECHLPVCRMRAKALNLRGREETAAGFFQGNLSKCHSVKCKTIALNPTIHLLSSVCLSVFSP